MKKTLIVAATTGALLFGYFFTSSAFAEKREVLPTVVSVNMPHVLPPNAGGAGKNNSPAATSNLTYHNGPVMSASVNVVPLYWGTSWANASFTGDKIAGLKSLYAGYNNSTYANISTQYLDSSKQSTSKSVTVDSATNIDLSIASSDSTKIFNKIVEKFSGTLSPNSFYPVYTDIPRGNAGYCAWHSYGTVTQSGITFKVKFAFFFSLAGDSGCSASYDASSYSKVTQSLANVSAHELAEAMTDPELNAWYDKQGYENADKCAWKFSGVQTLSNDSTWALQGEWSNATSSCVWSK